MSIDLLSNLINNYLEIIKTGESILPLLNELNESQIAIVCHCRQNQENNLGRIHSKLYYIGVFNFSSYNFILYFFNEQTIIFKII
jgi:hypothetical protein